MEQPGDTLPDNHTRTDEDGLAPVAAVRRFRIIVVEGSGPGRAWDSTLDACSIGSHPSNHLVLADDPRRTVSRFHCEVRIDRGEPKVRDLESRNGTLVDGVRVSEAFLRHGSALRLGQVTLRFELGDGQNRLPVSARTTFGGLAARSVPMRLGFALMERAAASEANVLLEGESGTGKTAAAEAIHDEGPRRAGPFIPVDCGAIPPSLIESVLFGHEKGAFTGAQRRRAGHFEEANGGTLFLDEIGELPLELQPKLLSVLESRKVLRIGSSTPTPVDVRIIAATNRDLREEVNAGRFRPDLFYRLAVLRIVIPPLRQRPEDVPLLADRLLDGIAAPAAVKAALRAPELVARLQRSAWPGNVRELRNYLERCVVFQCAQPLDERRDGEGEPAGAADASLPHAVAKDLAQRAWERAYLGALLGAAGGNVTVAAATAGLTRQHLHRLLRRYGMRGDAD